MSDIVGSIGVEFDRHLDQNQSRMNAADDCLTERYVVSFTTVTYISYHLLFGSLRTTRV